MTFQPKYHYQACAVAVAVVLAAAVLAPSAATRADDTQTIDYSTADPVITPSATPQPDLSASDLRALQRQSTADSQSALGAIKEHAAGSPKNVTGTLINRFTQTKDGLLARLDQLTPAERREAAQECAEQENVLETLMSSVSEDLQMNLIEALARCQLLE